MGAASLLRSLCLVASATLSTLSWGQTITPVGNNGVLTVAVSNSDSSQDVDNGLATPGTYAYADSFSSATAGNEFYDSYVITVMPGQIDAITTTINGSSTGISGLASRLFSFTPGPGVPIPTTTPPPSGTLINGWTNVVIPAGDQTGYVNVLSDPSLTAGTYVLQIEGTPLASGGSYGGSVNLTPTPLPASGLVFVFGLVAIGLTFTRSRLGADLR